MRIIVELPDEQITRLKALGKRLGLPRTELLRRAVTEYLSHHPTTIEDSAFGLWKDHAGEDGLAYQRRLRVDWDKGNQGTLGAKPSNWDGFMDGCEPLADDFAVTGSPLPDDIGRRWP